MPGEGAKRWAGAHKTLTAVLATVTALAGLATSGLSLRAGLSGDDEPTPAEQSTTTTAPTTTPEPEPGPEPKPEPGLTLAAVAKLENDVQLSRFTELLGRPASRRRLQNEAWLESAWESPDIAVTAFSNRDSQVVAYTVTALGPEVKPMVEHLPGGLRLRDGVFADVPVAPTGVSGAFPPNGRWFYEEFHRGTPATADKSVVLAASFAANADDAAATQISDLYDCLPSSVFEEVRGCPPSRVKKLRTGLHVTSMTVGDALALEALAQDGALFYPPPDTA